MPHHVIDIVPTLYDILDITPPKVVSGAEQTQIDGVSMAYTFDDADAPTAKKEQFFDNFASRGIYKDGWMTSVSTSVRQYRELTRNVVRLSLKEQSAWSRSS